MTIPWLTILALLPAVGAVLLIFTGVKAAKQVALGVSLITFAFALIVATQFRPGGGMQLAEQVPWIKPLGAYYALGLDGLGLTLVLLVVIITPVVVIASWRDFDPADIGPEPVEGPASTGAATIAPKYDARMFFALLLAVQSCALYLFLATDVFLFYVFFEVILVPMYFLIGGFGPGPRRTYAAAKFLIFGLLGGFVMLASVIGLYVQSATAGQPSYLLSTLSQLDFATGTERWLFVGFMFAFAIKAPLVPLHTWLPDAAEESTAGSATMMVGVMDKIGTFGMIRFCLGLFPEASQWATPVVLVLATISILYGAILAISSRDIMRFIAYTSISHFGFIVLGIFAFTSQSLTGSTLYMLNHGMAT
ncbi:MAG TPA: NADH-quinone oxidoreductase subunit M, partial [Propionibacteriaceae bacterium]|nr:NADH-quinone oxidoreductase subunit M [Propionibacteriaceae bacterium]